MNTTTSITPTRAPQSFSPPAQKRHRVPGVRPPLTTAQIALVKAASPAVDTIGSHVELRRIGRNYTGDCPWHESRSHRSFVVSTEFQNWRCWACNIGGDVINFIERFFATSFHSAVLVLARRAGIDLDRPLPEGLVKKVAIREELAAIERQLEDATRAVFLDISRRLNTCRRLQRSAIKRLADLKSGARPRWRDEQELAEDALAVLPSQIRKLDAAYCLVAFGERDLRQRFAVLPDARSEMVAVILEAGFITDDRGHQHRVGIQ